MEKKEFKIEGMECEGCVNRIKRVLDSIKNINYYDVSLETETLVIEVKNKKILEEVVTKINNLGFTLYEK